MRAVQLRREGRGPGVWLSAAIAVARSAPALALAAALLAVGCRADDEGGDELPFLSVPHLVGEVELRVGDVDGDLLFDRISEVEVGPDGNVYVLDRWEAGVRVFTPEGEPLRSIGRRGGGPGEFRFTPRIVEWRDDALLAWDGFRQTWLDLEGNVLSTAVAPRPLQPGQETGINAPEFALAGGGFLYRDSRPEMIDHVLVHVSEDGEVRDTLHVFDLTSPELQLEVSTGGIRFQRFQPFLARDVVVVQPRLRSLVTAEWILDDAPRARVVRRTMEGDTIYQVSLAHRPVQLRAEVVDERVGTLAQTLMRRAPHLSQDAAQRLVRGALNVPEQVRPATQGLGVDDGGVWLRFLPEALGLEPPRVDDTSGSLWVDLDPAGEIRAVVGLPPGFRPRPVPATDGAEVWGVFTGDFGVHQLARVRLRSAVGSELAAGGERDMALLRPSQDRAAAGSMGIAGTPIFLVGRAVGEQVGGWVLPGYDRAKMDAHMKVALRAVSRYAAGNPD